MGIVVDVARFDHWNFRSHIRREHPPLSRTCRKTRTAAVTGAVALVAAGRLSGSAGDFPKLPATPNLRRSG